MTYKEAVEYLLEVPKFSKKKTDPEDLTAFLERLGNPQEDLKVLHVAGTNGKGSVCAFLTSVLCRSGKRTGTFTSPHLIRINERFAVNGEPVTDEVFMAGFHKVYQLIRELEAEGYHRPTFFEHLFLMAMVIFSDQRIEYAVLETGLGGRLDATNVIARPQVTVITSIGLDHMQVLGGTIAAIAAEKAGIIKPGVPVIYDASDAAAAAVIEKAAAAKNAPALPVSKEALAPVKREPDKICFALSGNAFSVPFPAAYQAMNGALAVTALWCLFKRRELPAETVRAGLNQTVWPGRMEQAAKNIYLDGAHNVPAMIEFVRTAKEIISTSPGDSYLLLGITEGKDYQGMIRELNALEYKAAVVTGIGNHRGMSLRKLQQALTESTDRPVMAMDNTERALEVLLQMKSENDKVFCVGSLYLVGEAEVVLRRIKER